MRKTTWRDIFPAIMLAAWLVLFALAFSGCATDSLPQVSTDGVGNSVNLAQSHVVSAEQDTQRIRPHADKTGQAIVDIVSDEHKAAERNLDDASEEVAELSAKILAEEQAAASMQKALEKKLEEQKTADAKKLAEVTKERDKYKNSYGYRAEEFVISFLMVISILIALHFLLPLAATFLPMIFPATIVAVPLLRKLGTLCNPLAWFQAFMDHIHCPVCPKVVS